MFCGMVVGKNEIARPRLACLRCAQLKLWTARSLVSTPFGVKYDMIRQKQRMLVSRSLKAMDVLSDDVGGFSAGCLGARSRDLIIGGGAISAAPDTGRVSGIPIQPR